MKRLLAIALLCVAPLSAFAGTGEAYIIGFGAGLAFKLIPWTNHKIAIPLQKKVQRTIRPVQPQDNIEKAERKAEKQRKKAERAQRKAEQQKN